MNVEYIVENNLCTGCGTCVSACPTGCIRIEENMEKGIYVPVIDKSKCVHCGICLAVCPSSYMDFMKLNLRLFGKIPDNPLLGNYISAYIGYATDAQIRYNSSSGGVVTALLSFMIDEGIIDGALVTVMDENNPLRPKVIIATSKKDVISASGSKYCPVPLNIGLRKIAKLEGCYAVVGLPCHIHGIRKFELYNRELRRRIRYHFGLFCANTVSFLGTEYLLERYGIQKSNVHRLRYRGEGWPGMITVVTREGEKYKIQKSLSESNILYRSIYSSAFHYDFMPYRCLLCPDQTNELSDISFGDPWLPSLLNSDSAGFSLVVSRTEAGQRVLSLASKRKVIKLYEINKYALLKAQFFYFKARVGGRIQIFKYLGKRVPNFTKYGLKEKVDIVDLLDLLLYLPSFFSHIRSLWKVLLAFSLLRHLMLIPLSILRSYRRL